jgi:LacI family transcriptional regulator
MDSGRRVPEEFSIVGCDDVRAISDEHGRNILTTVDLSLRSLGEIAGRLLVELVTGKVSGDVRRRVPARLVVRASTAEPRPRISEAR